MSDLILARIRTVVPITVGAFIAWLATEYGVVLDETTSAAVIAGATGLCAAIWHALFTALERRWPQFGWLLGHPGAAKYGDAVETTATVLDGDAVDRPEVWVGPTATAGLIGYTDPPTPANDAPDGTLVTLGYARQLAAEAAAAAYRDIELGG